MVHLVERLAILPAKNPGVLPAGHSADTLEVRGAVQAGNFWAIRDILSEILMMEASAMTNSIPTIKDVLLGVDRCPLCGSDLAEKAFQRKVKKRVPVGQLSHDQLFALGARAGMGDVVITEVVGDIPILACSSAHCTWFIPVWAQDDLLRSQPGIPELPECDFGHHQAWWLRYKIGHRLDLQCCIPSSSGKTCPSRRSIWLAPPGGFLAGSPSRRVNETKAYILAALSRSAGGLTLGDIVTATALSVPQVSAALDRYRKARTPSVGRQGPTQHLLMLGTPITMS